MNEMNKYYLFFASINSLGSSAMSRLLEICDNEKELYELKETYIKKLPLTARQISDFLKFKRLFDIDSSYEKMEKMGMKFVTMNMPGYPVKLNDISNKPYQLFYYGELPKDDFNSVAIIGARNCSGYGREMAGHFAYCLAKKGVQIISGMASGIDGISQRQAIEAGGKSYGILGCGIDICYPESNRELYEILKDKGGVISEFAPGTKPVSSNFPVRNRIISGLSDIVLVVEAKEKSGTAITVGMALDQGRDVYAVPGRNTDNLSKGCNRMIAEGAGIAGTPEDIFNELDFLNTVNNKNMCYYETAYAGVESIDKKKCTGNSLEASILFLLKEKDMTADQIAEKLPDNPVEDIKVCLLELSLNNIIKDYCGIYSV